MEKPLTLLTNVDRPCLNIRENLCHMLPDLKFDEGRERGWSQFWFLTNPAKLLVARWWIWSKLGNLRFRPASPCMGVCWFILEYIQQYKHPSTFKTRTSLRVTLTLIVVHGLKHVSTVLPIIAAFFFHKIIQIFMGIDPRFNLISCYRSGRSALTTEGPRFSHARVSKLSHIIINLDVGPCCTWLLSR